MRRVDSFLKETIRMGSIDILGLMRKASRDQSFSDGTFIPKGTRINAAMVALHHDDGLYENPEVFDPFRFAAMGKEDGEDAKHQFAAASPKYFSLGYGRHVCLGRLFAAKLKVMLARVTTTYDGACPRCLDTGAHNVPNPTTKVKFRKRARQGGKH